MYSLKFRFLDVRDEDKRSQVKDADKLHSTKKGLWLKTAASAPPLPPPPRVTKFYNIKYFLLLIQSISYSNNK